MVDDSNYLTPHEAALAVVATAMKKARLQLDTLVINSILGGVLFSSGSILYVACHSENLDTLAHNPGFLNFIGGLTYSVGLFYVVLLGAELFNSDILYFSVGFYRGAVSIFDVLISWFFSWIGNIAGSLFVSYVFIEVSGIAEHEKWDYGARHVAEDKAAYAFMQTFIKAIAGNFFVCLAVYLQLMAKPIHVKFLMILLPVFTFVSSNFTHVVADMTTFFIAMLRGADVSVGRYIWRVLIPGSLGTIVGGAAFGLVIPFYLHLLVVERDRAKLSLPEYEARDEQPELNMDSRVVRMPVGAAPVPTPLPTPASPHLDSCDDTEVADEKESLESGPDNNNGPDTFQEQLPLSASPSATASSSSSSSSTTASSSTRTGGSLSTSNSDTLNVGPTPYSPATQGADMNDVSSSNTGSMAAVSRMNTIRSITTNHSTRSSGLFNTPVRSPPGVFPVAGMGAPLARERTIENSNYPLDMLHQIKTHSVADARSHGFDLHDDNSALLRRVRTAEADEEHAYVASTHGSGRYSVPKDKLGSRLEKVVTRLGKIRGSPDSSNGSIPGGSQGLPRTVQDTFPHNNVSQSNMYDAGSSTSVGQQSGSSPAAMTAPSAVPMQATVSPILQERKRRNNARKKRSFLSAGGLLKSLSNEMSRTDPANAESMYQRMSDVGITSRAAMGAQNVAGEVGLNDVDVTQLKKNNWRRQDEEKNLASAVNAPPLPAHTAPPASAARGPRSLYSDGTKSIRSDLTSNYD